jgi:murein DD-endopeptidase MepM/ murein hydrolase activator NlpD
LNRVPVVAVRRGEIGLLFQRRSHPARRKLGQALVPAQARGLPAIYLAPTEKTTRSLPPVYLCEASLDGPSGRLKWLASTCLAGMVGVCLIGIAIYASQSMGDGSSGMMSSIKRASLAALQPLRPATRARDGQNANGQKEDRSQVTSAGFATRDVIHDTVVQRQGSREYITIEPYVRIVAGLATTQPADSDQFPPFNPFKLYSDSTPIGAEDGAAADASQFVSLNVVDVPGGLMSQDDGVELKADEIDQLVTEAAENFSYAEASVAGADGQASDQPTLQPAAYHPEEASGLAPNITVIHKNAEEADNGEDTDNALLDGSETKTVTVSRGDTLTSIIAKVGGEPAQAKAIVDAMAPVFAAQDLKPGQEVRFTLVPAPSDTGQMEPVRVSVFAAGDIHLATVARTGHGDYVATTQAVALAAADEIKAMQTPQRATLYTSFYHAALSQHIPPETILKLLRVHSYDVDFKQKVAGGDTFEVFFDMPDGQDDRDGTGEALYTSMTVDGQSHSFYRFRSPDGLVDYYDDHGNSAKKFLMRNPVKGGRYTSGFGERRHPLLGIVRMHTGVDWAAPVGTPIVAGGDGTVEAVGREGGYGNYIRIRHANGFSTAYGHLSRYADGLEPGIAVKQGQVIGYVGSTGLSSGPHCHYEILVNAKFVNPMTIQVPRGLQLTGRQLAEFQKERKRVDALMQLDPVTARVATAQ